MRVVLAYCVLLSPALFGTLLMFYILPSIVATGRHHPDRKAIAIFNLVLGWTLFGWMIALIWAYTDD